MGVREPNEGLGVCGKCFAGIPQGASTCPECGAPTTTAGSKEIDPAIYPEIARANLHRMRGELKEAEEVCLKVLKRFPNNAIAHTMLGDFAAERRDWAAAVTWYELALDLTPDSISEQEKLFHARAQIEAQESKVTVEHLGLPPSHGRTNLYMGLAGVFTVLVAAVSYFVLRSEPVELRESSGSVNSPVILPDDPTPDPVTPTGNGQPSPNPAVARPNEDVEFAKAIKDRSKEGALLLEAISDPGSHSVTLTFIANEGDDERLIAARLAETSLNAFPDLLSVKLRAVRDKTLIFTAVGTRSSLVSTRSQDWKELHGEDEAAWAGAFLTNEWSNTDSSSSKKDSESTDDGAGEEEGDSMIDGAQAPADDGSQTADPENMPGSGTL